MSASRQRTLGNGGQHVLDYLKRLQTENPSFFYAIQGDSEHNVGNIFWADATARMNYTYFGDTVIFDTTYRTSGYRVPFAAFTGQNHHGHPVLLGCALILNESESCFTWLFQTWLHAMSGRHPVSITTDPDRLIQLAVAQVLPETRLRFSKLVIFKETQEKLANIYQSNPTFETEFKKCINETETIDEFESSWESLLERYYVMENEWLQSMYNARQQWVPVYMRNTFFGEISASEGSGVLNSFFDAFVNASTTMQMLIKQYEKAVAYWHEKEVRFLPLSLELSENFPDQEIFVIFDSLRQMVNKEDIDFFLNFPRKELQSLCKKYGLPANRSSSEMAVSLISFYEKKSSSSISLGGGLGAVQEASGPTSLVPLLQSGAPLNSTGDTRRDEDIGGSCSPTKKFHSMGEAAYDKETIYGSMHSLFVPQLDGIDLNNKENPTLTSGKNNLGIGRDCKSEDKPCIVDADINGGGCLKENVPLRSSTATRLPEFEFYVGSENGINLCVDLNFNPSDWINKLTSEVSLPDNMRGKNHRSFHQEIGCFAESNEQVKNPVQRNLEVCQSNKGHVLKESARNPIIGEKNHRSFHQEIDCSGVSNEQVKNSLEWNSDVCQSNNGDILKESARNPMISENNHLPSDHPDEVEGSLLSSIEQCTKVIGVVENFEEEDGQNNSSILRSAAFQQIVSHTESHSKDVCKITLDSVVNSPQKQLAVDSVVNMADGSINLNTLEHQGRELPIEICENSFLRDACEHSCTISYPGGGCVKMPSSEVEIRCKNASLPPREYVKSAGLVDTVHSVDAQQDGLANASVSSHETYRRCFPSFPEEQEMNKVDSGRELSEYCQHDSLEETFVGHDGAESNEFRRKRPHIDEEDQNSCDEPKTKIMRSATLLSNQVTPRRSVRLVSQ